MIDQLITSAVGTQTKQGERVNQSFLKAQLGDAKLREQFRSQALKRVQSIIVLTHIAKQENITVPQQEIFESIANFADKQKFNFQQLRDNQREIFQEIKNELTLFKAVSFVLDNGQITWEKKEA